MSNRFELGLIKELYVILSRPFPPSQEDIKKVNEITQILLRSHNLQKVKNEICKLFRIDLKKLKFFSVEKVINSLLLLKNLGVDINKVDISPLLNYSERNIQLKMEYLAKEVHISLERIVENCFLLALSFERLQRRWEYIKSLGIHPYLTENQKVECMRLKEKDFKKYIETLENRVNILKYIEEKVRDSQDDPFILYKREIKDSWRGWDLLYFLTVVKGKYKYAISKRKKLILTNREEILELYSGGKRVRVYKFENGKWKSVTKND